MTAHFGARLAQFRAISRFPQIRRDISLTVPEGVAFAAVGERVSVAAAESLIKNYALFDVYQGEGSRNRSKKYRLRLDFTGFKSHSYG